MASRGFRSSDLKRLKALGPATRPSNTKRYEPIVHALCDANQLPRPVAEFKFHPTRKWRADFAWVAERVVLEVDGGTWVGGRHTRGSGWQADAEKRRAYAALGYLLVPCTPQDVRTGIWLESVRDAIRYGGRIIKMQVALNQIAAWNEGETVTPKFDSPAEAKLARAALSEEA